LTPFPTSFTWKAVQNTPVPRAEGTKFVAGGKFYTFGGFVGPNLLTTREVDVFDPATNTWSRAADTPDRMTHAATAVDEQTGTVWVGMFFLHDGLKSSTLVWKYNVATNTWSTGPSLPQGRGAGAMAIVGRELHAWGGLDTNQKGRAEHWRLDLNNPSAGWVTDTPMPRTVNHHGGVALNGKLYSIGGIEDKIENTSNRTEVLIYDPATRQWTQGTPLPVAMGHIGPDTFVYGNHIVIAGGQVNADNERLSTIVLDYNAETDKWSYLPSLPAVRKSAAVGIINGKIIVANGNMNTSPYLAATTWVSSL
jgi:N-acetylneuraminic acid mutarotase